MFEINLLAVLLAAVASMVVGFAWYSPMLFGKPWMKLMGIKSADMKSAQKKMMPMYGLSFLGALLMAFVLSQFGATLMTAFWAWVGFVMPVQMTDVIFGSKKWMLFAINTGYQLTSLIVMGVVLGLLG